MTLAALNDVIFGPSPNQETVLKLAAKVALRGGMQSRFRYQSQWSCYCTDPVTVHRRTSSKQDVGLPLEVTITVPCRKCPRCLQFRRLKWRQRLEDEYKRTAGRTWVIRLSFDPIMLAGILAEADTLRDSLEYDQRVDMAAYRHLQRYFKRLRRQGFSFRYFFVFERGDLNGRPHYHGLIHEVGQKPIPYRALDGEWRSHTHVRLFDEALGLRGFRYLTKYLGKSLHVRPRASLRYGLARKRNDALPFTVAPTYGRTGTATGFSKEGSSL